MLSRKIFDKIWTRSPHLFFQRLKVRNLPKETYSDRETPYMKMPEPKKSAITDVFITLQRKDWSLKEIRCWATWKKHEEVRMDQKFQSERHKALGPDLAVAHFMTARNGKVKFAGREKWLTKKELDNNEIPSVYKPGYLIEEIDASNTLLCYEGLENLNFLHGLKRLTLRECWLIDDWCLGRFYFFKDTLDYLDLSGCVNISERGLCSLHVLKRLKTLVLHDTSNVENKELVVLLLQECIPECEVIGADFSNPLFLKRLEKFID